MGHVDTIHHTVVSGRRLGDKICLHLALLSMAFTSRHRLFQLMILIDQNTSHQDSFFWLMLTELDHSSASDSCTS